MELEKKKVFLINLAYWAVLALISLAVIKYVIPISLPFIFGFLAAYLVICLSSRIHCSNRWMRLFLAVVLYGSLWFLAGFLTYKGVDALSQLADWLPEFYAGAIAPWLDPLYAWGRQFLTSLDPTVGQILSHMSDALVSGLSKLVSMISRGLLNLVSGAASAVPSTLLGILAMMFSTFFAVVDSDRILEFGKKNLPPRVRHSLEVIREYLTGTLFVVLRAYLLIMLLTFTELAVLFSLFGIEHPIVKAGLIAVLDILPLLGTGGIMIPWAIISMVLGNVTLGIELLIIYVIVTLIRNYVEPKIVGVQLGLHPIITLAAMFLGMRLFGFFGLFGLPVAVSFLWKQYKSRAAEKAPREPDNPQAET